MLTTREKRRLRLSLPQTFQVEYEVQNSDGTFDQRTTTIEPNFRWVGSDVVSAELEDVEDYPVILLSWESQGGDVPNESLLNRFAERVFDDDFELSESEADAVDPLITADDTEVFIEAQERRYEAELQITPVVETDWVDGVPPQPRTETMARQLWRWVTFRASAELNSVGERGERPLVVEPDANPTPARMMNTYRAPMSAFIRHTASFKEVVPVVQDEDIETTDAD